MENQDILIETKESSINYRFKILYAIAILMVLSSHSKGGGFSLFKNWFPYGGLHLALFMFSSGYFYKKSSEDAFFKYLLKKFKTLIIPFYIYNIVYGLIVIIMHKLGFIMGGTFTFENIFIAPIKYGTRFTYNFGGWFIVPLFLVEIFNVLLRKVLKLIYKDISEWLFFGISITLGLLGNQLAIWGFNEEWGLVLTRFLFFVPFYELGILYKNVLEKYDKKIPNFWYFAFIIAIRLFTINYYGYALSYNASFMKGFEEGALMPIIIGFLGIALWIRIANILNPVIGQSKFINIIANSTYSIMMNHMMCFMLVKGFYYILSKYNENYIDFDVQLFKSDAWWIYVPKGLSYNLVVYVIVSVILCSFIQNIINQIKGNLINLLKKLKVKENKQFNMSSK